MPFVSGLAQWCVIFGCKLTLWANLSFFFFSLNGGVFWVEVKMQMER
jgi:hypothetical protein